MKGNLTMAIYDEVKSNIMRQELQLIEAGQHYKIYSAKVKYLPTNIEKPDFFRLCYGMLTKCDEITVYTFKKDTYEVLYKYVVTNVDIENKEVSVRLLLKVDFLNKDAGAVESTNTTQEISLEKVEKLIDTKIKAMSEVVAGIDTKVETLTEATTKYQVDTDDQLEEIEAKLEDIETNKGATEVTPVETTKAKPATTKQKLSNNK